MAVRTGVDPVTPSRQDGVIAGSLTDPKMFPQFAAADALNGSTIQSIGLSKFLIWRLGSLQTNSSGPVLLFRFSDVRLYLTDDGSWKECARGECPTLDDTAGAVPGNRTLDLSPELPHGLTC